MGCYALFKLFLAWLVTTGLLRHHIPVGTVSIPLQAGIAVVLGAVAYVLMASVNDRLGRIPAVRGVEGPIPDPLLRILFLIDLALSIAIGLMAYAGGSAILDTIARRSLAPPLERGGADPLTSRPAIARRTRAFP